MAIRFHMFSIEHLQQKNCLVYDRLINRKSTNTKLNSYSYDLLCFNTNNEISIILQKLKWKWKKNSLTDSLNLMVLKSLYAD